MELTFIFQIAILIFSVVIHEVSHGYAALLLGDRTAFYQGRLTLNPLRHLDPVGSLLIPLLSYILGGFIIGWAKPVPFNPYNLRNQRSGEAIVAAAGPLANIAVALIFGLMIRFLPFTLPQSFVDIAAVIVFINILLAVFNLVPIPPLDGSKILFSFLPFRSGARVFLERYGLILVFLFIFVLWRVVFPLVSYLFHLVTGLS
ncbi:site-2 protease family protein [Patescibacteria group bacterium]|nr:MAG: site-2 protease family protein [Patescibacteria group bacterium]